MKKLSKRVLFGEVAEFRNGLNFSKESRGSGCILIGIPEFKDRFTPDYSSLPEINPIGIARPDDYVQKNDILFVRSNGNKELVGRSLFIDKEIKALFSGFCIRARIVSDEVDPNFCAYFTRTSQFKSAISAHAGTNINNLNQGILGGVELPQFSLASQRRIAAVLSALDAKIAINHRINGELEGMAKLLYDYWFVQYDFPLSAAQAAALGKPRLAGKPYRTSGGPMVYQEHLKREIPKGWVVKPIEGILAKEGPSKKIPASEILKSGSIPVIDQSKDFICGFTNDEDALIRGTPKIIFGDHTRILKFINFDFARGADGTQMIASNSESMPPHLFYHSLLKIDLSSYGYARHFKFLKQSNITLPDSDVANHFEEIVAVHYKLILENTFQNQELTTLRDWLLPMLMNGQVRVG